MYAAYTAAEDALAVVFKMQLLRLLQLQHCQHSKLQISIHIFSYAQFTLNSKAISMNDPLCLNKNNNNNNAKSNMQLQNLQRHRMMQNIFSKNLGHN